MKRLFYSTVAVLAFSVSGMANTIELKESKKQVVENTFLDCYQVAEDALQLFKAETGIPMTPREEYGFFSTAYNLCVNDGKCTNCLKEVTISAN